MIHHGEWKACSCWLILLNHWSGSVISDPNWFEKLLCHIRLAILWLIYVKF
jgi:hypothetical protein